MRDERSRSSDRLRRMAVDYEASITRARAEQMAARAVARAGGVARPAHHRLVGVLAGFSIFLLGAGGLGFVADGSLPGDPLYRVDRAYEAVGAVFGFVDPIEERLEEAIALADRGDREAAVLVASEALAQIRSRSGSAETILLESTTTTESEAEASPDTLAAATTVPSSGGRERADDDPVEALKAAAGALLQTVRDAKTDPGTAEQVDRAAMNLALAVSSLDTPVEEEAGVEDGPVPEPTTTVSGAETSSSTTTTQGDPQVGPPSTGGPGRPTTTTAPDSTSTTTEEGSTTTSAPSSTTAPTSTSTTSTTVIILEPLP